MKKKDKYNIMIEMEDSPAVKFTNIAEKQNAA